VPPKATPASDAAHIPVLLDPIMAAISPVGGIWLDGTFGAGGYSRALLDAGADRVLAVEIGGPNMACARVEMAMMGRVYTDFLTLVFDRGRWSITAKVFHFDIET